MSTKVKDEFSGMPEIPAYIYDKIDEGFHKYLFFETVKRGHRRYTCTACHKTFEEGTFVSAAGGRESEQKGVAAVAERKGAERPMGDAVTATGGMKQSSSEDFALFHAHHNDEAECPLCGARATVKNAKIGDVSKFWDSNCVAVFMANGPDDVWIRAIYADRSYCYKNAMGRVVNRLDGTTNHFECARYHITPGQYDFWKSWGRDYPLKWQPHAEEPFSWNHGLYVEKYDYHMAYVTDIKDTFLRYHGATNFYRSQQFMRYLCHYAEHPQLEMLLRMDHTRTVWEVVMENRELTSLLDWSAKKPWDLYRLPKQEYNEWAKYRYDLDIYKIFKRMKGKGKRDWERAKELDRCFHNLKGAYGFIAKARRLKTDLRRLMNYIHRVQQSSGVGCWQCPGIDLQGAYTLWCDYINLAEGVGRGKTISVMPKDLKAAHDALLTVKRTYQENEKARNEIDTIKRESRKNAKGLRREAERLAAETKKYPNFTRFYKRIAPKYTWGNDTYTVCAPESIADVIYDGLFLKHCVGNQYGREPGWYRYLDRIRSGESFLLFLRHTKKQGEPYYILEVEPGGVVRQKRTVLDRQDPRDIEKILAFLAEWQAAIQTRLTAKDKQAAKKSREIRVEQYAELRRQKVEVRNGFLRGKLLADVLEADLLEIGFAPEKKKNTAHKGKERKVG